MEGWAWGLLNVRLLRDGEILSCVEDSAHALLLSCGQELAVPAALIRRELQPVACRCVLSRVSVSHRMSVCPLACWCVL